MKLIRYLKQRIDHYIPEKIIECHQKENKFDGQRCFLCLESLIYNPQVFLKIMINQNSHENPDPLFENSQWSYIR